MSALFLVGMAHALSHFPALVEEEVGMACTPSCMLCHDTPAGGSQTANQPFAVALVAEGLLFTDDATLGTALDAVAAGDYDSDEDGGGDVGELLAGTNPNPGGIDFCPVEGGPPELTRGCAGESAAVAVGVTVWALALRRRRAMGADQ